MFSNLTKWATLEVIVRFHHRRSTRRSSAGRRRPASRRSTNSSATATSAPMAGCASSPMSEEITVVFVAGPKALSQVTILASSGAAPRVSIVPASARSVINDVMFVLDDGEIAANRVSADRDAHTRRMTCSGRARLQLALLRAAPLRAVQGEGYTVQLDYGNFRRRSRAKTRSRCRA